MVVAARAASRWRRLARPPLIVLAGATATGKTALSLALAEELRGRGIPAEIISADSRQVYRGMDIGTAKATAQERARVPHHCLDLVDPDRPFSVSDFCAAAADGAGRDRRPRRQWRCWSAEPGSTCAPWPGAWP